MLEWHTNLLCGGGGSAKNVTVELVCNDLIQVIKNKTFWSRVMLEGLVCFGRTTNCMMYYRFRLYLRFCNSKIGRKWQKLWILVLYIHLTTDISQRANFGVKIFLRFSTLFWRPSKYRHRFDVEWTSKFQRLSKFRRFFDDRRNILTFFKAFSTTVEISTSIQRWIDVENARWDWCHIRMMLKSLNTPIRGMLPYASSKTSN